LGRAFHRAGLAGATLLFLDGARSPLGALHLAGLAGAMLFFLDGAGPLLSLALHLAGLAGAPLLFLGGAGPFLGRAWHRAGLPFVRRAAWLGLRRTLGSMCRPVYFPRAAEPQPSRRTAPATVVNKLFLIWNSPSLVANCRTA
jgi:hypothetical protein